MHTARINFFTAEPSPQRSVVIFLDGGGVAVTGCTTSMYRSIQAPRSRMKSFMSSTASSKLSGLRDSGSRGRYSSNV